MIVFSKTLGEHIDHVDDVLTALQEAGVSFKIRKCQVFTHRIRYLRHIIRPGTLEVKAAATASVKGLRHPKTPGELPSFLEMCNVYRRFINGYTEFAAPLYTLLEGDVQKSCLSSILPRTQHAIRW